MTKAGNVERRLTDKEKNTLYGLVKYPGLKDRELADRLNLRLSTVTAIRRRLRESDYYFSIRFPMLQHLGCELLTLAYGKLNHYVPKETKNKKLNEHSLRCDNSFLMCSSDDMAFVMSMTRNYTEVKKDIAEMQRFLSSHDIVSDSSWYYALFPFEVSKLLNLFDYTPILSKLFDIDMDGEKKVSLDYEKTNRVSLTTKEKSVFQGLIDNPEMPDNAIAKKVGVSRQALSNIRRRFESEDLIRVINIPNIKKLGLEILVLSHVYFNPKCMIKDRRNGIQFLLKETPQFFTVSGSFESIIMHSVTSYDDFNFYKNKLLSIYTSHDFIKDDPRIILLPITDLEFHKRFDFSSVVRRILQSDE